MFDVVSLRNKDLNLSSFPDALSHCYDRVFFVVRRAFRENMASVRHLYKHDKKSGKNLSVKYRMHLF